MKPSIDSYVICPECGLNQEYDYKICCSCLTVRGKNIRRNKIE